MNKKQIIKAMLKTVNLDTAPIFGYAMPANNDFVFANSNMAFFDSENPAELEILESEKTKNTVDTVSEIFNTTPSKNLIVNRKKLGIFIKENKLRNGTGQNIYLFHDDMYFGYNAKWLYWIMDYCKSDIIDLVESHVAGHFTAICTGDNCKALLLPVRINTTPTENIFTVDDVSETPKKADIKHETHKKVKQVDTPKKTLKKVDAPIINGTKKPTKNDFINIGTIANCSTLSQLMNKSFTVAEKIKDCNVAAWDKFQEVFNSVYPLVKDWHSRKNGEQYKEETRESSKTMFNIIKIITACDGLTCEMVGRFLWTGGKQKQYADIIKSLGFTFQENKSKYCRSYDGYIRHDGKRFSYATIKKMYSVQEENTI